MNEPVVYLNDGFVPASQAHLKIYDLGIVPGCHPDRNDPHVQAPTVPLGGARAAAFAVV